MKNFHSRARISSICKTNGTRLEDSAEIKREIIGYFKILWSRQQTRLSNRSIIDSAISKKLTEEQKLTLGMDVSDGEVKEALWYNKDGKAPIPNGFNAKFFKKEWNIVGDLFTRAVKSFFCDGQTLKEINHTSNSLI